LENVGDFICITIGPGHTSDKFTKKGNSPEKSWDMDTDFYENLDS
jgi:hypothetical protein